MVSSALSNRLRRVFVQKSKNGKHRTHCPSLEVACVGQNTLGHGSPTGSPQKGVLTMAHVCACVKPKMGDFSSDSLQNPQKTRQAKLGHEQNQKRISALSASLRFSMLQFSQAWTENHPKRPTGKRGFGSHPPGDERSPRRGSHLQRPRPVWSSAAGRLPQ